MLLTVVSTNCLEGAWFSSHGRCTTNLFCCALLIHHFGGFIEEDYLPRILLLFSLLVLLLHDPGCIREIVARIIWLTETVHLDRIIEATFPHSVSDNFHFLDLDSLGLHLGFLCDFRKVHVHFSLKIWKRIDSLFGHHLLNIHDMFPELLHINSCGVMDLRIRGDVSEGV